MAGAGKESYSQHEWETYNTAENLLNLQAMKNPVFSPFILFFKYFNVCNFNLVTYKSVFIVVFSSICCIVSEGVSF